MSSIIAIIFFGIGIAFNFFGCLGLLRLPDVYNRLQASTKCVTFGTIFILFGVLIFSGISAMGIKAILCLVFILITSPAAAHAISKGSHFSGVRLWKNSVIDLYKEDKEAKREDKEA
ncbi:MAG: monovalent cation/H(+) antiporter subunit G [Spirochaetota bacterium]